MKEKTILKAIMVGMAVAMAALGALAMPTRAQFQQMMPMVKEISAEDSAAVKAGTLKPKEAGDRALERASDTSLDEASRYLFFEAAFSYYIDAAEYDNAAEVVSKLKSDIKNVPDSAVVEFIERRLRNVKREHAGQLYGILQDARTREEMVLKVVTYRKAVKANPKDTISQSRLAYCNVLIGNWTEALKAFAASEGQVATFSQAEIGRSKPPMEIGNFWWSYTINDYDFRNYSDQLTEAFQAHAKDWYRMALKDTSLTGVRRNFIAKRVGEEKLAEVAEVKKPAKPSEVKETVSVVKTAAGVKLPTMTFDLGTGVKMEFIQCPAGTFTMGAEPELWGRGKMTSGIQKRDNTNTMYPHKVTITRPFWMSKYPVTIRLLSAVTGSKYDGDEVRSAFGPDSVVSLKRPEAVVEELTSRLKGKLPKGYVVRFPTEAEFDYAFKANSTDENDLYRVIWQKYGIKSDELSEIAHTGVELSQMLPQRMESCRSDLKLRQCSLWYSKGGALLGPIGKKRPNAWGLHDMMMGALCMDVVSTQGGKRQPAHALSDLVYADEETDPLRITRKEAAGYELRNIAYRPEFVCHGFLGIKEFGEDNCALRIVIGPDLEKEKRLKK